MQTRYWVITAAVLWVAVIVIEGLTLWSVRPFGIGWALNLWGVLLVVWVFALIKASPQTRWRWAWRILPPFTLLLPALVFMAVR